MATSDRTQLKQVMAGSIGDGRSMSTVNPLSGAGCVAQDAQRFVTVPVGGAALGATSDYTFGAARVDRPVQIKEVRILPGGALVAAAGNLVTINYGYTNDGGGSLTVMGTCNTNTAGNGGTGNWAAGVSVVVAANTSVNAIVPSGSHLQVTSTHTGASGVAVPGGTCFQIIWEEV